MRRTLVATTAAVAALLAACTAAEEETGAGPEPATGSAGATRTAPAVPAQNEECTNPKGGTCLGLLEPGEYRTTTFRPGLGYAVPTDEWTNLEDLPGQVWFYRYEDRRPGLVGWSYFGIYRDVRAAAIDCTEAPQEGVGLTPEELVAWFRSVPGLVVSEPKRVSIGGLEGLQIDLDLEPGVVTCRYGRHTGIPLTVRGQNAHLHHVLLHGVDVRLAILAWEDGNIALEITNVRDQHTAAEYRAMTKPIIDSLEFSD